MFGGSFSLITPLNDKCFDRLIFGSRTQICNERGKEPLPPSNSSRIAKLKFFPTNGIRDRATAEKKNNDVLVIENLKFKDNYYSKHENFLCIQIIEYTIPNPSPPVVIKKYSEYSVLTKVRETPLLLPQ